MSFRTKLALFLLAILGLSQVINAVIVQHYTRAAIIAVAKSQLARASDISQDHIRDMADRLAKDARVAAQDYPVRDSLVNDDFNTKLGTLKTIAQRISAGRAMLISLDGAIVADTLGSNSQNFPFKSMLEGAENDGASSEIVFMDGMLCRLVVVPVKAPDLKAYLAAAVRVDDGVAQELRRLSAVNLEVTFAYDDHGRGFRAIASTMSQDQRAKTASFLGDEPENRPQIFDYDGREYVTLAPFVPVAKGSPYVIEVLQYALDDALAPYSRLFWELLAFGLVLFIGSLVFALYFTRSLTSPLLALASVARRIAMGDFSAKVKETGRDEIGQLATAFNQMTQAIAEREARISHQADHDLVTDLPNRRLVERHLDSVIEANPAADVAVALVGVDRLPEINNTLGHDLGDRLIRQIGPKLIGLFESASMIGRIADSVFAIVMPKRDAVSAQPIAAAAVQAFEQPVALDDMLAVDASVRVGIAAAPIDGSSARVLLQRADVALFTSRQIPSGVAVYDSGSDPYKAENLTLMGELKGGIDRGELQLHYQPKIAFDSNRLIGAEALVRWIHPKHGFLPPDRFIPLAEESGTIHKLTTWALSTGIRQMRRWHDEKLDLKVAINLSVRDLLSRALPDLVAEHLQDSRLAGDKLILEITESAIMRDPDSALLTLRRLADQGIRLSIDDFGTGHSSFAYLRRLPIAEIKVDKSFVLKLANNIADQTIVRTIVELGHNLDLKITAEGVEDQSSYDLLASYGCDVGQGFFMSRPLSVDKFESFARESPYAALAA